MITIDIRQNDHPALVDAGMDEEAEKLGGLLKQAARWRQRAMVQWYLDQLADHFHRRDRTELEQEKETAVQNEVAAEIRERQDRLDEGERYMTTGPGAPISDKEAAFLKNLDREDLPTAKTLKPEQ